MIFVKHQGTLGNQMWQYAVGRIVAEFYGHTFFSDRSDAPRDDLVHFQNCVDIPLGIDKRLFIAEKMLEDMAEQNVPLATAYKAIDNFFHSESSLRELEDFDIYFDGHIIPDSNIMFHGAEDVYMEGYFQRYEYVRIHKEKLAMWFTPDRHVESYLPFKLHDDDLLLSIRRGWNHYPLEQCPPASFYERLIEKESPRKIILCTDDFADKYFDFLKKYDNVHYADHKMMTQYCLIKAANKVVLSPSTFCWWASWLGNASVIYYPWFGDMIPHPQKQDWLVDDDPRYVIVKEDGTEHKVSDLININTAGPDELASLPGLGKSKAQAIIAYRIKHGDFLRCSDLLQIPGVGAGVINKISNQGQGVLAF